MTTFDGFAEFADDLQEFADDCDRAADRIENEAVDAGTEQTAYDVLQDAQRNAPVKTGELRDSGRVVARGGGWAVEFTAVHAKPQEYGAGPHLIRADEAEVLRFPGEGGEWVFRKEVSHPGNAPQPYLRPALDANQRRHAQHILSEIDRILAAELS